mmetsp:Transcript_16479/g.25161  ORF Transcript_16479/g.25161 Transcript_16479/m.25161 type:complete len:106 (-) Transcript_16479:428-745(-)
MNQYRLFDIEHIGLEVKETEASLLNPIPTSQTIHLHDLRDKSPEKPSGIMLIPNIGAKEFRTIVEIIQNVAFSDPEQLKFSAKGGFLYMDEKGDTTRNKPGQSFV